MKRRDLPRPFMTGGCPSVDERFRGRRSSGLARQTQRRDAVDRFGVNRGAGFDQRPNGRRMIVKCSPMQGSHPVRLRYVHIRGRKLFGNTNSQFALTQRATGDGGMELVVRALIPRGTPFEAGTPLVNGVPTVEAFPQVALELDGPVGVEDFDKRGELSGRVSTALETVNVTGPLGAWSGRRACTNS